MYSISWRVLISLCVVGVFSGFPVLAQDMSVDHMLAEIEKLFQDQVTRKNAIEAGRERAVLCHSCHGEDGNSIKPGVPNLAGQNAGYLLEQINHFANGERKDFVMNQLAENFSVEDKINIAVFYNAMQVKPPHVNWHLAAKGEVLYNTKCASCHGEEGLGHLKLARLAGQQVDYVRNVLTNFRSAANHVSSPTESLRRSPAMEQIAKNLTDEQIDKLANYVGQLSFDDYYEQ